MTEELVPPLEIPRIDEMPWEVGYYQVGSGYHVGPHKDLLGMENWALVNPDAPVLWKPFSYLFRVVTGTYLRRAYPKSERALRRSIAECERWCEVENAEETKARETLARVREQ